MEVFETFVVSGMERTNLSVAWITVAAKTLIIILLGLWVDGFQGTKMQQTANCLDRHRLFSGKSWDTSKYLQVCTNCPWPMLLWPWKVVMENVNALAVPHVFWR